MAALPSYTGELVCFRLCRSQSLRACLQIVAARPADVSADAWLLSLAISSLLPAAIYVGMTWRVLHKIKHSNTESDQAVAVVAALCIRNAQTIEQLTTLLDGLDSHPTIGTASLPIYARAKACWLTHHGIQMCHLTDFEVGMLTSVFGT